MNPTETRPKKPLVLIVDDVPTNLHVLASALRLDYRIKTASNGPAALDLAARDDTPDLILLDVMMPEMSGHEVMQKLREGAATSEIPVIFVTADAGEGSEVHGLELGACDFLAKPVNVPVLMSRVRNLLRQRQMQAQLQLNELKLRAMLDSSMQFIGLLDKQGRVLHLNRQIHELLGMPLDALVGQPFFETSMWAHGTEQQEAIRVALLQAAKGESSRFETQHVRPDGEAIVLDFSLRPVMGVDGEVAFLLPEATDITLQKQAEENIRQLANYDPLTGLPNRTLLTDRVRQAIRIAARSKEPMSLMFLDLDRFKHINDTLGHSCGDRLLIEIADRLVHAVRATDTVARLGGDEFVLLLPDTNAGGASIVAEKVMAQIARPVMIDQHELAVTPSIGIAMFPSDGSEYESLSKSADIAMYRAKRGGRNMFCFYTPEMNERSSRLLHMEVMLRHAVARDELVLYYQPQIAMDTGELCGVEALIRWKNPEFGLVAPGEFIPLAEETGLILPIGEWVIRTAARQARKWLENGWKVPTVAINVSAIQLRQKSLPETLTRCLEEVGLSPEHIELELTESAAFSDPESAIAMLAELHKRGFKLSIDDFGTGYSSLNYLKRIHIDKLKIDQSFVRDLGCDPEDETLVEAIISMARSLKLRTIAEGVETVEQLEYLRGQGCNSVQGFLYSKPLPVDELEGWIRERAEKAETLTAAG